MSRNTGVSIHDALKQSMQVERLVRNIYKHFEKWIVTFSWWWNKLKFQSSFSASSIA